MYRGQRCSCRFGSSSDTFLSTVVYISCEELHPALDRLLLKVPLLVVLLIVRGRSLSGVRGNGRLAEGVIRILFAIAGVIIYLSLILGDFPQSFEDYMHICIINLNRSTNSSGNLY